VAKRDRFAAARALRPLTSGGDKARGAELSAAPPDLLRKEPAMWKLAALLFLLCAGCGSSDFYRQDTRSWFSNTESPEKTDQAKK
jgi:hypothetical protein